MSAESYPVNNPPYVAAKQALSSKFLLFFVIRPDSGVSDFNCVSYQCYQCLAGITGCQQRFYSDFCSAACDLIGVRCPDARRPGIYC